MLSSRRIRFDEQRLICFCSLRDTTTVYKQVLSDDLRESRLRASKPRDRQNRGCPQQPPPSPPPNSTANSTPYPPCTSVSEPSISRALVQAAGINPPSRPSFAAAEELSERQGRSGAWSAN
ncbi:hypothetical protein SKAU_G00105070 [Synaphobranchus kaupii]|uniref:Uncharacterized protein n=1 Tax=Synaphobranchus kaupii TaxID=118154 RepID=A0A9Q1FZ01_SYNKA|nr:hypothetical protein SKAU_G00105070 [Synaphobranchus kaupii]